MVVKGVARSKSVLTTLATMTLPNKHFALQSYEEVLSATLMG